MPITSNPTSLPAKTVDTSTSSRIPASLSGSQAPNRPQNNSQAADPQAAPENASESIVDGANGQSDQASEAQEATSESVPLADGSQATDQEGTQEADSEAQTQEDAKLSKRFAALSRKERQLQETQRIHKAQIEEAKQVLTSFHQAKSDPTAIAKFLGHPDFRTYLESLIQYAVNQGENLEDPEAAKVSQLEKKVADFERRQQEAQQQAQQDLLSRNIEASKKQIRTHIETNPDQYELIALHNAHEEVWDTIEEYYNQTGKLLVPNDPQATIKKAADLVEDELFQEDHNLAQKFLKSKKLGSKVNASNPTNRDSATAPSTHAVTRANQPKTLTNKVSAPTAPREELPLDRDEARRRTIERIRKENPDWK